jgi:nicotinamide-nucleotide amidase
VVAYATELKATLLGVDAGLLADAGPIHPDVARGMADGVRTRLGAAVGISTTGVAGPDPQDGHAPGEVWLGFAVGAEVTAVGLSLGETGLPSGATLSPNRCLDFGFSSRNRRRFDLVTDRVSQAPRR